MDKLWLSPFLTYKGRKYLGRTSKRVFRSGRDSELLSGIFCYCFGANRRDFSFSQLMAKRLGLVDNFGTFRIEQPGPEFLKFLAD